MDEALDQRRLDEREQELGRDLGIERPHLPGGAPDRQPARERGDDLGPARLARVVLLARVGRELQQPRERAVLAHVGERGAEHGFGGGRLAGRRCGGEHRVGQAASVVGGDGDEQLGLRAEVVEDDPLRHARASRDVGGRGRGEAALREQRARDRHQPRALPLRVARALGAARQAAGRAPAGAARALTRLTGATEARS